jgi:putative transposase
MIFKHQLYEDSESKSYIRILEVDNDNNNCYIIRFNKDMTGVSGTLQVSFQELSFELKKLVAAIDDPTNKIMSDEDLTDSLLKRRDERFSIIEPIVKCKPNCYDQLWVSDKISSLIREDRQRKKNESINEPNQELVLDTKVHTRYKYKSYLQVYFLSGERKNSLISNHGKCGGAGKPRVVKQSRLGRRPLNPSGHEKSLTENDKVDLKWSWENLLDKKRDHGSIKAAYELMLEKFYPDCAVYPSESQFKHWGPRLNDPTKSKKNRVGYNDFRKDYRALIGNARKDALVIGAEAQLDATEDDTHALSIVLENTYIGRLTLFLMPDTLTSMPLGIALVPDTPNYEASCLTLINAAKDKVEFCKTLDIDIEYDEWPCQGLSAKITSDLGLLFGKASDSIVNGLGIEVNNTEGESPFYKPIVERHIGKLLNKMKVLLVDKGLVMTKDSPRIAIDPRKQATLNYKELLALMIHEMLYYIKTEPIEGYPTPFEMQQLGILPTSLNLWQYFSSKVTPALLKFDAVDLAMKLLPTKPCSYDRTGIDFFGKWQCATEEGLQIFNTLLHGNGPKYLKVGFNRLDRNEAYLIYQEIYYKLYPINKIDEKIYTFYEMGFYHDLKNTLKKLNKNDRLKAAVKKINAQNEILEKATQRKKKLGPVNTKDKESARKTDKDYYYTEHQSEINNQKIITKKNPITPSPTELSMPDFDF